MNINEFKKAFAELADGVPVQGANSGQWKRLVSLVDQLEVEVSKPVAVKTTVEKKTVKEQ